MAYYAFYLGVDEQLAVEIARCESNFIQSAVSRTNDIGVMQISLKHHAATAKKLGYNLYNLDDNIRYGVWLIWKNGAITDYAASSKCWKPKIS